MATSIKLSGLGDALQAFEAIAQEIGDKKAQSKILIPAAREALKPALVAAQAEAPVDTGGLRLSLRINARRPTRKDRNSKYITGTDTVIAMVTTASGKQLAAMSQGKGLISARKKLGKLAGKETAAKFSGIQSDGRAIAQEFGTAKTPAKPYLRPALENNSQTVVNNLAQILHRRISQYRAKNK